MKYNSVEKAVFIRRPNRFIAHVLINGAEEIVHVKNTGRCKEILQEGTDAILEASSNPLRKTRYSLISAYKGSVLINIDSQAPNTVAYEAIRSGRISGLENVTMLKREVTFGNSRFDLYFETDSSKGFIEVKGATLESDGIAMFPDAPTERGTKHVHEMIKAVEQGYRGYILFIIQMKGVNLFTTNSATDMEFAKALESAEKAGVGILAYDAVVTEDSILLDMPVEVRIGL